MSLPPHLPISSNDNEYVHIRSLIANIHRPRNVSRPPTSPFENGAVLEVVQESPTSSDTERSGSGSERSVSERSEIVGDDLTPTKRAKSNSFAGSMLSPAMPHHHKRRRPSFLHLNVSGDNTEHLGPVSAGAHFNVPKFTVTAPPGEHRRFSHGFAGFHGFALRRHSNTVCATMIASVNAL
ncbi:uncharacterized protein LOC132901798 [Amyelois transitella]|uniref:uncharacterized protein LOC132901798 n=1 Tax=Amyelois transitella TaxID=680683 RepID=UPI00298F7126|nr:uncharacterized protein LOC132901798 [Amyelois transitella]